MGTHWPNVSTSPIARPASPEPIRWQGQRRTRSQVKGDDPKEVVVDLRMARHPHFTVFRQVSDDRLPLLSDPRQLRHLDE